MSHNLVFSIQGQLYLTPVSEIPEKLFEFITAHLTTLEQHGYRITTMDLPQATVIPCPDQWHFAHLVETPIPATQDELHITPYLNIFTKEIPLYMSELEAKEKALEARLDKEHETHHAYYLAVFMEAANRWLPGNFIKHHFHRAKGMLDHRRERTVLRLPDLAEIQLEWQTNFTEQELRENGVKALPHATLTDDITVIEWRAKPNPEEPEDMEVIYHYHHNLEDALLTAWQIGETYTEARIKNEENLKAPKPPKEPTQMENILAAVEYGIVNSSPAALNAWLQLQVLAMILVELQERNRQQPE